MAKKRKDKRTRMMERAANARMVRAKAATGGGSPRVSCDRFSIRGKGSKPDWSHKGRSHKGDVTIYE